MIEQLKKYIIQAANTLSPHDNVTEALKSLYVNIDGVRYGWSFMINEDSEDVEYYDYLEELCTLLSFIPKDFIFNDYIKKRISDFMFSLSWDNFMNEKGESKKYGVDDITDDDFYSLGSMFYNKLEWISEGASYPKAVELASSLSEVLIPVLDKLELIIKENEQTI